MKKILKLLTLLLVLIPIKVYAASGSINVYSSSSNVTLNNSFTVTVKVSESGGNLGSWVYHLQYDSSKVTLVSGVLDIASPGDGTYSSKSYSYKFRAIANGKATFSISGADIVDWDSATHISTSSSGTTVTIKEAVSVTYSSNNNLSSLSIDGFELSPTFNKGVLEYTATATNTSTSVKINAKVEDS